MMLLLMNWLRWRWRSTTLCFVRICKRIRIPRIPKLLLLLLKWRSFSSNSSRQVCSSANRPKFKGKGNGKTEVAAWRFHKNHGDSVEKDGQTWYWCLKHNNNKGLYLTHWHEDHDKRSQFFSKKKDRNAGSNDQKDSSHYKKKMALSDNLKAAMVSKFKCSDTDARKLWSEVVGDEKDF